MFQTVAQGCLPGDGRVLAVAYLGQAGRRGAQREGEQQEHAGRYDQLGPWKSAEWPGVHLPRAVPREVPREAVVR